MRLIKLNEATASQEDEDQKHAPSPLQTTAASVLAKLAEDVIALNRPLNPSELTKDTRTARVARLDSLRCGLKILRKEEPTEGEVKRLFKE